MWLKLRGRKRKRKEREKFLYAKVYRQREIFWTFGVIDNMTKVWCNDNTKKYSEIVCKSSVDEDLVMVQIDL